MYFNKKNIIILSFKRLAHSNAFLWGQFRDCKEFAKRCSLKWPARHFAILLRRGQYQNLPHFILHHTNHASSQVATLPQCSPSWSLRKTKRQRMRFLSSSKRVCGRMWSKGLRITRRMPLFSLERRETATWRFTKLASSNPQSRCLMFWLKQTRTQCWQKGNGDIFPSTMRKCITPWNNIGDQKVLSSLTM